MLQRSKRLPCHAEKLYTRLKTNQVQAIGMYGAAQPDFFKSETT